MPEATEATQAPPSRADGPRRRLRSPAAAAYCGLSDSTMRKMRTRTGGPLFMRLSGVVVYDTADLDTWMEANLRASTADK